VRGRREARPGGGQRTNENNGKNEVAMTDRTRMAGTLTGTGMTTTVTLTVTVTTQTWSPCTTRTSSVGRQGGDIDDDDNYACAMDDKDD
jgi:hypothetical protein